MGLMLTGCMQSAPCQVRAARGGHQYDHERWRVAAPRARRGQVTREGARAHGAHVERAGGRCMGHGQDYEGIHR